MIPKVFEDVLDIRLERLPGSHFNARFCDTQLLTPEIGVTRVNVAAAKCLQHITIAKLSCCPSELMIDRPIFPFRADIP